MMKQRVLDAARRGFSLIELLVVMGVIALIVAIVVPALGAARDAAQKNSDVQLANQITQACLVFQQSENRLPGYFSARQMGANANITRGFSAMQNAMLDLMGGVDEVATANGSAAAGQVRVGPTPNALATVTLSRIGTSGAGSKAYFTPPAKNFRVLESSILGYGRSATTGYGWVEGSATEATNADRGYKEMVGAKGNPLMLWSIDDSTKGDITATNFAQISYAAATPARFYWASNAAFLGNNGFTPAQSSANAAENQSLLREGLPAASRIVTLMGLLGNPAAPLATVDPATNTPLTTAQILPSAPRGQVVVQTSGLDKVFMGNLDKRGRGVVSNNQIFYGANFNANGTPSTDVASLFDDVIISGG